LTGETLKLFILQKIGFNGFEVFKFIENTGYRIYYFFNQGKIEEIALIEDARINFGGEFIAFDGNKIEAKIQFFIIFRQRQIGEEVPVESKDKVFEQVKLLTFGQSERGKIPDQFNVVSFIADQQVV
jgi:hypothetical protein